MSQSYSVFALIGLAISCAGCSNQSSHFANPFYAPDRVPPPSTRSLAPGSAQPYYSGDPLPPLQSGTQPALVESISATTPAPSQPLNWNPPTTINNSPPPVQPASAHGLAAAPSQEVLPVSWSQLPPESPAPRVRLPQTPVDATAMPPAMTGMPPTSSDGFQPRLRRPAPY